MKYTDLEKIQTSTFVSALFQINFLYKLSSWTSTYDYLYRLKPEVLYHMADLVAEG